MVQRAGRRYTLKKLPTRENVLQKDVCFTRDYVELYENKENAVAKTFHFTCSHGEIVHSYLKREIPMKVKGETYYDVTSPYGYGGPVVIKAKNTRLLFEDYHKAFNQECKKENIISAFYRFHLMANREAIDYFDGELQCVGPHVVRNLKLPLTDNFHKSVKRSVKLAQNHGLVARFDTSETALNEFLTVYKSTMDRNEADHYYYFDRAFFEDLQHTFKGSYIFSQAVLDGKVVSTFLTLLGDQYAFGFLGGTLSDYFSCEASTFLEFKTIKWLKDKGLHYYIMGGGLNGKDNLYRFKRKFDQKGTHYFYVGKKIYDNHIYEELVKSHKQNAVINNDSQFFPLYREKSK